MWQIATTAPAAESISACSDASWCGKLKLTSFAQTFSTNAAMLKAFADGTTYNVYIICTNDIPLAQNKSAVRAAGNFKIADAVVSTPVTPVTTTSSSFVSISMMSLIFLLALIFN
jgi:hypothetical protein